MLLCASYVKAAWEALRNASVAFFAWRPYNSAFVHRIVRRCFLVAPEIPLAKAELIERLEAYAQIKQASQRLDALVRLERDVFLAMVSMPSTEVMTAELPSYSPTLLIDSLFKMQLQPDYQMHHIQVDAVPLSDRIASISRQLSDGHARSFYQLLDKSQGKIGIVVSFVAVLELMKRQWVGVIDNAENEPLNQLQLEWLL